MHLKNIIIGIGIIILTIAAGVYLVNTLYESPSYDDYCGSVQNLWNVNDSALCESYGGRWNPSMEPKIVPSSPGYCDITYTCMKEYDAAYEDYSRTVFLISIPLGIIIIAVGAFAFGLEAVGAGLMAGGVGIILWGVSGFWSFAQDWLKLILSLAGLVALIWLAYYFNRKFGKRKR